MTCPIAARSAVACPGLALAVVLAVRAGNEPQQAVAAKPADVRADAGPLDGTWIFEAARRGKADELSGLWTSAVVFKGGSFAVSRFAGTSRTLKGSLTLGTGCRADTIDLKLEPLDLSNTGIPIKIAVGTFPGVWKLDGDRLTVLVSSDADAKRPAGLDADGDHVLHFLLVRAPAGFDGFPNELTVKVTAPDGRPASGVTLTTFMTLWEPREKTDKRPAWTYARPVETDADGTAKVKYDDLRFTPLIARDPANGRMAVANLTPANVLAGEVRLALQPECRVRGTVVSEQLNAAGKPVGWTNVYLGYGDRRVSMSSLADGGYELVAPPGTYSLHAYGTNLRAKSVTLTVPPGKDELRVDPIDLPATRLALLAGNLAPEPAEVVGWKGVPVKLANLRGRYVLLDFWGHWCDPCVAKMPVLIELQERFGDKGLAVVGVHVDTDGKVDTAEKLDAKLDDIRKRLWHGKDLPFPVALTSGKRIADGDERRRTGAVDQYGVTGFPTTILIDKEGRVVGTFNATDLKAATAEVRKLLGLKE